MKYPAAIGAIVLLTSLADTPLVRAQPVGEAPDKTSAHSVSKASSRARNPRLVAIFDDYLAFTRHEAPVWATLQGDLRFNDKLTDASPQGVQRRRDATRDFIARLEAIPEGGLGEADRTDRALLLGQLRLSERWAAFYPEQSPMTSRAGPQFELPQLPDRVPLGTPKQRADYVVRLEGMATLIDQHIQQMRFGMNAGRVPPRVSMEGAVEQCRQIASPESLADPTRSPFYKPFRESSAGDPLATRARNAIGDEILPAFERLAGFLEREYIPACRDSIAAIDARDGEAMYALALRQHTTTDLTPDQIHEIGVREVARIRAEMIDVIRRSDWYAEKTGEWAGEPDEQTLFSEFVAFLRSNPQFYHTDPAALLQEYRAIAKRIDGELARLFRLLPMAPYGIRPLPLLGSEHAPNGYYYQGSLDAGLPANFVVNISALDQRPRYEMIALALHEGMPGHHLQIALAQELDDQHPFRSEIHFTAFQEGWALYCERLGLEMGEDPLSAGGRGLYENAYDDFGRLTYEMWRACRLVVDTGMHAKGWARDRSVQLMRDNTALSFANIDSEINRYIGWPGQACGYKLGELKIREWRAAAEDALGEAFDIRAFHEVLLSGGELPLDLLEERVMGWIDTKRSAG